MVWSVQWHQWIVAVIAGCLREHLLVAVSKLSSPELLRWPPVELSVVRKQCWLSICMKQKPQDKLKKNSRKGLQEFEMSTSPSIIAHADWQSGIHTDICMSRACITEGTVWTHLWQWTEVLQNVPIPLPASPTEMGEQEVHLRVDWGVCRSPTQCNSSTCDCLQHWSKCHSQAYV